MGFIWDTLWWYAKWWMWPLVIDDYITRILRTIHIFRNFPLIMHIPIEVLMKSRIGMRHKWFVSHNGFDSQLWIGSMKERWESKWVRVPYRERYSKWVCVPYVWWFLKWVRVPWRIRIHKKVELYEHVWTEPCPRFRFGRETMLRGFRAVIYLSWWTQVYMFLYNANIP